MNNAPALSLDDLRTGDRETLATYVVPEYYTALAFNLLRPLRRQHVEERIEALP
jgi:hypothetical protein